MQLVIFGGFLGAGKTSLILSLAHYLVEGAAPGKPSLVILENEIGEVGIDQKVLQSGGFAVRELFAGCICCTLAADLVTTLNDLRENLQPDWVIFEPTGLAYPGKILETLRRYGKEIERIFVVSVVDAERWEMLVEVTPALVEGQVSAGDLVLINKCDLVGPDVLGVVRDQVRGINPRAEILEVSVVEGIDPGIWRRIGETPEA